MVIPLLANQDLTPMLTDATVSPGTCSTVFIGIFNTKNLFSTHSFSFVLDNGR